MKKIIFLFILTYVLFFISPVYAVLIPQESTSTCLTVGFWVEDSTYDYFDPSKNPLSHNTFEQWSNNQMASWNKMLKDAGVIDCFRIDKIVKVRDGELPLIKGELPTNHPNSSDRTVDIQWGFPKASWLDRNIKEQGKLFTDGTLNGTDWGLLHELSHVRYLVDLWCLNIDINKDTIEVTDPEGKSIIDNYLKKIVYNSYYFNKNPDIMGTSMYDSYHSYSSYNAQALNRIAGHHNAVKYGNFNPPRNSGIFLDDLPKENTLRVLDKDGSPLSEARISIFQSVGLPSSGFCAKHIDKIADITGITDINGQISIGSNPFGDPGYRYYGWDGLDFKRKIIPNLENGIFILEVAKDNLLDYKIIEVSDFNLAYWSGATEKAIYEIKTNLIAPPIPIPTLVSISPTVESIPTLTPELTVTPTVFFPTPTPLLLESTPTTLSTITPTPVSFFTQETLTPTPTSVQEAQAIVSTSVSTGVPPKTISKITINDQTVDPNNPFANISLSGTEGIAGIFTVLVVVIYSDGTTKDIPLVFDYQPIIAPTSIPTPTSIPITVPVSTSAPIPTSAAVLATPTPIPASSAANYSCTINFYRYFDGCGGAISGTKTYCSKTNDSESNCAKSLVTISCAPSSCTP